MNHEATFEPTGGRSGGRAACAAGRKLPPGMTLAELAVTMVIVVVVILALGSAIAEGIRGWQRTYDRANADVVRDGYAARNAFDRIVRKATRQFYQLAQDGSWLEVYYYSDPALPVVDRYARLYVSSDGQLMAEHGQYTPGADQAKTTLRTEVICSNVSSCVFKADGRSAQMILTLDDGSRSVTIIGSAVMHNGG